LALLADSAVKAAAESSDSESEDADAAKQEYVLGRSSPTVPLLALPLSFPRRRGFLPDACSRCGTAKRPRAHARARSLPVVGPFLSSRA
jgi:hypothetical protein